MRQCALGAYPGTMLRFFVPIAALAFASASFSASARTVYRCVQGGSVSLAGGTLAAGGRCSISVPVTASAAGDYINTSGTVSAATAGTGNAASATLTR